MTMFGLRFLPVSALLASVLWALGLTCPTTPAAAQAPLDPQSLVGEWSGDWRAPAMGARGSGPYYVTIEKVEGDKVSGRVQTRGERGDVRYRFQGTVSGNQLTWHSGNATIAVTIDGTKMTGTSTGGRVNSDLSLTKTK